MREPSVFLDILEPRRLLAWADFEVFFEKGAQIDLLGPQLYSIQQEIHARCQDYEDVTACLAHCPHAQEYFEAQALFERTMQALEVPLTMMGRVYGISDFKQCLLAFFVHPEARADFNQLNAFMKQHSEPCLVGKDLQSCEHLAARLEAELPDNTVAMATAQVLEDLVATELRWDDGLLAPYKSVDGPWVCDYPIGEWLGKVYRPYFV